MHVRKGITIGRTTAELYEFWRNLENLPRFMEHIEMVEEATDGRSHWTAKGPAGTHVEWDAEIVEDVPGELIRWQSLPGSDVTNAGSVRFRAAPGDRGTEVIVEFDYDAPAGRVGTVIAKLFGEEPDNQIRDDLRRFKQVMETGEVVRSEGSLGGAGQGALKQRPAQAPSEPATEARP